MTWLFLFIYAILFRCCLPFIYLHSLWRARHLPQFKHRFLEKLGYFSVPPAFQNGIWIHTVSVGEFNAATGLIKRLFNEYPHLPLVITTTTATGSQQVKKILNDRVFHVFAPFDFSGAISRFMCNVKPKAVIIVETELWPIWFNYFYKNKIPVMLANARLSSRSFLRYKKINFLLTPIWKATTVLATQATADADRFIQLGIAADRVHITGNLKMDQTIPDNIYNDAAVWRKTWGAERLVFCAASTHEGEEEIVLEAFSHIKKQYSNALLLLVLRHPERANKVISLTQQSHYTFTRRSDHVFASDTDIMLGDTIGELLTFYAACDVAFVAGSLMPIGGHNVLEPAALGIPILTGPHFFNMKDITENVLNANAAQLVTDASTLSAAVIDLFQHPEKRLAMGNAGKTLINNNRGALDKQFILFKEKVMAGYQK